MGATAGKFDQSDTIAAISTPYGTGGIGIIRISGPQSFAVAERIFSGKRPFHEVSSHTVSHGRIIHPGTGRTLDDVLIIKMKAPNTFTSEDVVEISCHGGIAVLRNVLSLVLEQGVRAADPGEFTKRAFLNGRMDLTQAEAVIDLINSKTEEGSRAAVAQLEGKLSEKIRDVRRELISLIAHIEAVVDYPEHDIEDITGGQVNQGVRKAREHLRKIAESYERGRLLRDGITAAIIGKPNAGKSSLLNALAGTNRAIVTDIPGTTRDIIEEYINIKGIPVRFLDTAGIRNTSDPVELIGVERAQKAAYAAELILIVFDAQAGINSDELELITAYAEKKKIILINKTDIAQDVTVRAIKEKILSIETVPIIEGSITEGTGMDDLIAAIEALFLKGDLQANSEILVTNVRHRQLIDKAEESLESAQNAHESGLPLDFVTIDIKESAKYLGQITGDSVNDDIVREIFSRFCIGK